MLRPRAEFTDIGLTGGSDGSSYAHMLLARLEKRFSGGLQLQGNFQYSRVMQRMDRLNDSDPSPVKRVAGTDRPFRGVVSGLYNLPFGRGKNGLWKQMAPERGLRQPVRSASRMGRHDLLRRRPQDTTRFNTNSKQALGSNVRTFPIHERLKLQYQCEFFNVANHPLFDAPDVSATSTTFGKIQNQTNQPRRIQMALKLAW